MILLYKFIIRLIYDLFQFPFHFLKKMKYNYLYVNNSILEKTITIENNLNKDFQVIIHHFAPFKLNHIKNINGRDFNLGLEGVLNYLDTNNITCVVKVTESEPNYILELKKRFKSLNIEISKINLFDFGTYISNDLNQTYSIFLNDNIAIDFDFELFLKSSFSIFKEYENIGIIGLGSNSQLRISLFKKWFSPHVQTNIFMIKSDLMNDFIIKNQWFFKTKTSINVKIT